MGYDLKCMHVMVWKVVETCPIKQGVVWLPVLCGAERSATGHVKINAIEVVNTKGRQLLLSLQTPEREFLDTRFPVAV
jgi:hypothetical protein